jgi:outer membrane receptor for monomeric catechols
MNQDLFIDGVHGVRECNLDLFDAKSSGVLKDPSGRLFGRGPAGGLTKQSSNLLTDALLEIRYLHRGHDRGGWPRRASNNLAY